MKPLFETSDTHRRLLYRFGFLAGRTGTLPKNLCSELTKAGWVSRSFSNCDVMLHPEAPAHSFEKSTNDSILIIGHAYTESSLSLDDTIAAYSLDEAEALYDCVDTFAGRFALIAISQCEFKVFHDPAGSRSVFFSPGHCIVASHSGLLAAALNVDFCSKISEYMKHSIYARRPVKYLPGIRTAYENIFHMPPNMHFSSAERKIVRHWPRRAPRCATVVDLQRALIKSLSLLYKHTIKIGQPILGLTGGIDCRTALSIFRSIDRKKIKTATWHIKNIEKYEMKIIDQLVKAIKLDHAYLKDEVTEKEISNISRHNMGSTKKTGTLASILFNYYGNEKAFILLRGKGAELVRVFYAGHLWPMRSPSSEEMTRVYLSDGISIFRRIGTKLESRFVEQTRTYFQEFIEMCQYDKIDFGRYDINDIFYQEHRLGTWASNSINESDTSIFSMSVYNSRILYDIAHGLKLKDRNNKDIFSGVIRDFCHELYVIPITNPTSSPKVFFKRSLSFALRSIGK